MKIKRACLGSFAYFFDFTPRLWSAGLSIHSCNFSRSNSHVFPIFRYAFNLPDFIAYLKVLVFTLAILAASDRLMIVSILELNDYTFTVALVVGAVRKTIMIQYSLYFGLAHAAIQENGYPDWLPIFEGNRYAKPGVTESIINLIWHCVDYGCVLHLCILYSYNLIILYIVNNTIVRYPIFICITSNYQKGSECNE